MRTATDHDELLTTTEVLSRLRVHRHTLLSLIRRGELRAIRFTERGWYRFRPEDVEAFVAAHLVTPKEQHGNDRHR